MMLGEFVAEEEPPVLVEVRLAFEERRHRREI